MTNGAHIIVYSKNAEADKCFIKDVLKFTSVDVHEGWLIFKLPPAEVAAHEEPSQQNWGRLTRIQLPGGGRPGLYPPRHARP
jgi:hypothetical protein